MGWWMRCCQFIYDIIWVSGADTAFDKRTLTGYFAGRLYTIRTYLIAKNTFATAVDAVKSAFAPKLAFAPIAA